MPESDGAGVDSRGSVVGVLAFAVFVLATCVLVIASLMGAI